MEDQKPKRKYTRKKAKVEPLAVYAVMVTVARGRKTETIYAESTRVENGCLVIVSMDGPQPLVERTRYIPLGGAEITVCQRPQATYRAIHDPRQNAWLPQGAVSLPNGGWGATTTLPPQFSHVPDRTDGPRVIAGPLGMNLGQPRPQTREVRDIVERNADGIPVVSAGFLDGSPT